jgi:hypothetical protein
VICRPCRKLETLENQIRGGFLLSAQIREQVELIQDARALDMTESEYDQEQQEMFSRYSKAGTSLRRRKLSIALTKTKDSQFRARIWRALEAQRS